jgi:hypothetical protein
MNFINTGNGYLGDVISVAVIAFLIGLAAFIAANVIIARRYHASKPAPAAPSRRSERPGTQCGPATELTRTR